MDLNANRDAIAAVAGVRSRGDRRRALPARLLDRRPEFAAQPLARHSEEIAAGLARGHPQIAVGWSRVIQALVLAVDQDRSGRIGLEQHPLREVASADRLRRRRARPAWPKRSRGTSRADWKIDFARPAAADLPIDPLRLGDRLPPAAPPVPRPRGRADPK